MDSGITAPKIENFGFNIITANRQVDELTSEGFVFKPWYPIYKRRLDSGAIAFCGFAGKELAHVSWWALTAEAMKSLAEPPFSVDFQNNEAACGDYWTNQRYRGLGIAHYASRMSQQYMRDNGIVMYRGTIAKRNLQAQRISRQTNSYVYKEGRYLKILWWKFWKETPVIVKEEETPLKNLSS